MLVGDKDTEVKTYGFLIAVEVEPKVDHNKLILKLMEGPRFMEGIGHIDIEELGEVEVVEGDE